MVRGHLENSKLETRGEKPESGANPELHTCATGWKRVTAVGTEVAIGERAQVE